jgi:23S rRNA (uracil1939-C5)-methyltransferase
MTDGLEKNQLYRAEIEGYSSDGSGVARINGRAVFVARAAKGDDCEIRILKATNAAAWGKIERMFESSPDRAAPKCPYFGKCGGCDFQHITYAAETEAKRQRVEDCLRRIGGQDIKVGEIIAADSAERYRNKAQFPVGEGGRIGFYRERTHDVVDVEDCLIQSESASAAAGAVREWMKKYSIPAYDERTRRGTMRHVYVRTAGNGDALVCLMANADRLPKTRELVDAILAAAPETVGIVLGINTRSGNVILAENYRTLYGRDFLTDTLCGLEFRLSVPSFYQVNRAQAERLYGKAVEFAGLTGRETVLDLYCGTGTITLIMAKNAKKAIGAEIVPEAIADARENAARNGVENAEFFCGDASDAAKRFAAEKMRPDVAVVDPPRKGLAGDVVDSIAEMEPPRVVYVSCDPATLARDVKRFSERGYRLEKAAAVDLFPRTRHVETVVLMSRVEGK